MYTCLQHKEENTNSVAKYLCPEKKVSSEELKKKTEERSQKALQREQLKKDFKQLLQDLGNLSREKANLRSKKKSKVIKSTYCRALRYLKTDFAHSDT